MEANQNRDIDFSNYSGPKKTVDKLAAPPDLEKENRKNKIYMIVIAVCILLGIAFWGLYFMQNAPSKAVPGAMINEAGPRANLPGGGSLPR